MSTVTMEDLYSKLYDKYKKQQRKDNSEADNINKDQEVKFVDYASASDDLIKHLRTEIEDLRSQLDDMRSEMASNRSAVYEQCTEYQKLLMEEKRKSKEEKRKNLELSEEVEKLRNLLQVGNFSRSKDSQTELCTPASGQVSGQAGNCSQSRKTNKRRKHSQSETEDIVMPSSSRQDDEILIETEKDLLKESVSSGALITVQQPQCCRTIESPGGGVSPTGQANWLFQLLLEHVVGFKFSTDNQTEEVCIQAVHQSSGYSFSLTWVKRGAGKEAELKYDVFSMGSFERVAPEWMKDTIMFTPTMIQKFFEKLSCVVKGRS